MTDGKMTKDPEGPVFGEGEKAVFALRSLYRRYGYLPYKMSKFEEYDLYVRNKDFLVSDRVITFNDTNGKLMALKPDVTLSIVRGSEDLPGQKTKVCYNENVYRVSEGTHRFKEIMQAGIECIGDIDLYDIYEAVTVAAESLSLIGENYVLEVSNLGILAQALSAACDSETFHREAIALFARKNAHDLVRLCKEYGVTAERTKALCTLLSCRGDRRTVLDTLSVCLPDSDIGELSDLSAMLDACPFGRHILFDFSAVNNVSYYSGFVFRGFIEGICQSVLAGGQYDGMMRKMGKKSGAVGFAVYLDLLEQLHGTDSGSDVDILLLYDKKVSLAAVASVVKKLTDEGKSVSAQKLIPEKLRYGAILDLREDK